MPRYPLDWGKEHKNISPTLAKRNCIVAFWVTHGAFTWFSLFYYQFNPTTRKKKMGQGNRLSLAIFESFGGDGMEWLITDSIMMVKSYNSPVWMDSEEEGSFLFLISVNPTMCLHEKQYALLSLSHTLFLIHLSDHPHKQHKHQLCLQKSCLPPVLPLRHQVSWSNNLHCKSQGEVWHWQQAFSQQC